MKRAFLLAAAISMISAVSAPAQNMAADLMPPYEVSSLIASMGMRPLGHPVWRGDRYILFAIDRYGQRVRVVLDARDGRVLAVRPTMRDQAQGYSQGYPRYGGHPGYGAPQPYGYDQGYAPPPPPGYPQEGRYDPGQYGPRFGAPPAAIPEAPPMEDDYFDYDRQEGGLTGRPHVASRNGSAAPKQPAARQAARQTARNVAPMPKPRPPLAASEPAAPNAAVPDQAPPAAAAPVVESAKPKPGEAIRF